jgi:hypothetical protein
VPSCWRMAGAPLVCISDADRVGMWKAILKQAQVRDVRVHDARHTAATLLIEQGVHIRVVQEVLGHTRVTTTERYTHVATLQMKVPASGWTRRYGAGDEGDCNPNCNPGPETAPALSRFAVGRGPVTCGGSGI